MLLISRISTRHATSAGKVYIEIFIKYNMNDSDFIINDFKNNYISIKDLSQKYNKDYEYLKLLLKTKLKEEYNLIIKKIAGHYGSKAFLEKLNKDNKFKADYQKKMSKSVSNSIRLRMNNKTYKNRWLIKAKKASKLGHEKVRYLLDKDDKFRDIWIKNCKKGGYKTYNSNKGAFDPKNRFKRLIGSLKGLKNTGRKFIGPKKELMYNHHEVRVAKTILSTNKDYIYEKIFYVNNPNGHISCDFIIEGIKPMIIEATYWDDVLEKCNRFKRKYKYLKDLFGKHFDFIIVVNTQTLKHKYLKYLPSMKIFTVDELNNYLMNIN